MMDYKIPFNKPFVVSNEMENIIKSINSGHISGDGFFSKKCHDFFKSYYKFHCPLLTTSCTDALELTSLLLDIKPDDEVIIPSYTFVSTAIPFALRGAKIIFADSSDLNPNIDINHLEALITKKTKALVVVHYAGIACDMDHIKEICDEHNIILIEDAAQAINSFFKDKPLGGIGDMGAISFHETKNIICGEGGLWIGNNENFIDRARILRDKGTNRLQFYEGRVEKYEWVDLGSSYLLSDILAAFLYSQLINIEKINTNRINTWNLYFEELRYLESYGVKFPFIPDFATNNGHIFYMVTNSLEERKKLLNYLKENKILATFHYQSLHLSKFAKNHNMIQKDKLKMSEIYSDRLIRLPLFYNMKEHDISHVINSVKNFYKN